MSDLMQYAILSVVAVLWLIGTVSFIIKVVGLIDAATKFFKAHTGPIGPINVYSHTIRNTTERK